MSLKQTLMARLQEVQGAPKKSLGQNFLINQHIIDKIIFEVKRTQFEQLIEVGPGLGALTDQLKLLPQDLTLIEMDSNFANYWRAQSLNLHEADALKLNWSELVNLETCFVSNLPYQISARIVIDRSMGPSQITSMFLMFQKEVAERLTAKPKSKDYGFLSVIAQLAWHIEKLVDVSPQDFYPPPKVSSRVMSFHRCGITDKDFVQFVKLAFENRRKFMLKNFSQDKQKLILELADMGYTEKVRAEELSPEDFLRLFNVWRN